MPKDKQSCLSLVNQAQPATSDGTMSSDCLKTLDMSHISRSITHVASSGPLQKLPVPIPSTGAGPPSPEGCQAPWASQHCQGLHFATAVARENCRLLFCSFLPHQRWIQACKDFIKGALLFVENVFLKLWLASQHSAGKSRPSSKRSQSPSDSRARYLQKGRNHA